MIEKQQQGPADFVRWLAALTPRRTLCVECGAGRAELAGALAPRFKDVIAFDASPPAAPHQFHPVRSARAEALPLANGSVDLLFSMQAAHYFDVAAHVGEAKRALRTEGVFGVFSWGKIELPPHVQRAYQPVFDAVSPFWEPERDWVINGYSGFEFPGKPINVPPFYLIKCLTPEALDVEMATWSAVQAAGKADIEFPEPELATLGVDQHARIQCRWRIVGQCFRN